MCAANRILQFSSGTGLARYFSGIDRWDENFSPEISKEIEKYWNSKTQGSRFEEGSDKEKFYILSMFPYPSGSLHMGHVRVYTISDVLARLFRLRGKNVIHPMGWDAFGLPAENAALERGVDPDDWTQKNIANMKSLMEEMNWTFDWSREFATCDSDYYKWTQFFFLKMYERGLVYRKEAFVNWDPVDQTVLADEQVDESGRSWRSGAMVEKKLLKQWFVRTTRFAEDMYNGLSDPVLESWRDVIDIQKHWIGNVDGTTVDFEIVDGPSPIKEMPIWMMNPEYVDGAKFVAVKPKSYWTFGGDEGLLPYRVKNPFTNETLPVYATESVEFPDRSTVHLGIPDLNIKDKEFATSVGISCPPGLHNMASEKELVDLREKICAEARERGIGGYRTSSNLQDWLISRQRYWGTPIPMIFCKDCGEQPVPESALPVRLPKVKYIKIGEVYKNSLKEVREWCDVACPKCGGEATRETDTMDTFVDSSWYYLRFLDPDNHKAGFGVEKARKLMPVDVYIGGKEHATLHLYYARFMNRFLHSVDLLPHPEPFKRLLCQGMVRGRTYCSDKTGKYVAASFVESKDGKYFHRDTKEPLIAGWEKMSKSKHNGVEPRELLSKYGSDTTRLFVLSEASPWSYLDWDEGSFRGILIWQRRLWLTLQDFIRIRSQNLVKPDESEELKRLDYYMFDSRNFYLKRITKLLENDFNISTAIAKMQGLTNSLRKVNGDVIAFSLHYERALALQIFFLAPLAPCFACELWSGFVKAPNRLCLTGEILWDKPLFEQNWPVLDDSYSLRSDAVMGLLKLSKSKGKKAKKLGRAPQKNADTINRRRNDDPCLAEATDKDTANRRKVV